MRLLSRPTHRPTRGPALAAGPRRVQDLVAAATAAHPTCPAVVAPDGELCYAELNELAGRVAERLALAAVPEGSVVALGLPRSAAFVVAALGVLKAGSAYLPLDPAAPAPDRDRLLADAGAAAVLTGCPDPVGWSGLAELGQMRRLPGHRPAAPDLALVAHPVGGTGAHRTVTVRHAELVELVAYHRRTLALDSADRCTLVTDPSNVAHAREIWPALAVGATLYVLPDEALRAPRALRDWLLGRGVTVTFLPSALAEAVLGVEWPPGTPLRYLLTARDERPPRLPAGLPFTVVCTDRQLGEERAHG